MKKLILGLVFLFMFSCAAAEEDIWILCQPDSSVNIRTTASRKYEATGEVVCGWHAETTGETKDGFLYLVNLADEDGVGWIYKGYVVYSEPIIKTFDINVCSDGRVACWNYINGKRNCWVYPGDLIKVYAISEEWAVTSMGFIRSKYLGVEYDAMRRLEEGQTFSEPDALYWEDD